MRKRQEKRRRRFKAVLIVLCLSIVYAGVYLSPTTGPSDIASATTLECLVRDTACNQLQLARAPLYIARMVRSTTVHKTSRPSTELARASYPADCQNTITAVSTYQTTVTNDLRQTNQVIDALRQTAIVSGEPYQSFDNQVNAAFAVYNAKVETTYAAFLQAVHNCPAQIVAPTYFDSFTP